MRNVLRRSLCMFMYVHRSVVDSVGVVGVDNVVVMVGVVGSKLSSVVVIKDGLHKLVEQDIEQAVLGMRYHHCGLSLW
jgi:hypothetical protein